MNQNMGIYGYTLKYFTPPKRHRDIPYNIAKFSGISKKGIAYLSEMKPEPSFIAELYYRNTDEGGRSTPVLSGYRPQVKFPFDKMKTSGQQIFIDTQIANPGDTVKAEITIISTEHFKEKLFAGLRFEFREGDGVIGTGKLLEVLDEGLLNKCL
jgi:translation elongation factor EF-Tu-like GTPase